MPFVTTMNPQRQGKSFYVYNVVRLKLFEYDYVLVCTNEPYSSLNKLRDWFPQNVMQIVPNCGIRVYRKEFGK